ncbi:MAG: hypothetical protein MI742_06185 [Desulfobacterales bacterium]|nr:hypothetical protein [Desulfobacterales bacterium]
MVYVAFLIQCKGVFAGTEGVSGQGAGIAVFFDGLGNNFFEARVAGVASKFVIVSGGCITPLGSFPGLYGNWVFWAVKKDWAM